MGISFFVPFIILWVILPFSALGLWLRFKEIWTVRESFVLFMQILVPIASCIWNWFSLLKYVDFSGNELYYLYNRSKFWQLLKMSVLFFCCFCLLILIMSIWMPYLFPEIFRFMVLIFLYNGIVYGATYISGSTVVSMVFVLLYTVFSLCSMLNGNESGFASIHNTMFTISEFVEWYLPLLMIGGAAWWIGFRQNDKFYQYK